MNGHISSTENILGKKIKTLRGQYLWTQEIVANQLGISIPAFSKIESGLTTVNITRLKQLADLFETTPMALLGLTEVVKAADELAMLKVAYDKKTDELITLQSKAIRLHDELHHRSVSKRQSKK